MKLSALFSEAGLPYPEKYGDREITKIVTDSREATAGCMFISIVGHNNDGHEHIEEAVKKGADVIVAEQVRDGCVGGAAIVKVENTRYAAARLYSVQCGSPDKRLKIVGITGTNGKTGTSFLLESIFLNAGISCAVIGTLGCRINGIPTELCRTGLTTPDSAQLYPFLAHLANIGVDYVFMEVSSHALALGRVEGIKFEYGIFTNLTRDHLDFHGGMEEYFECKAALFSSCRRCVINVDSPYGKILAERYPEAIRCSCSSGDAVAESAVSDRDGSRYILKYSGGELPIRLTALGDFFVTNSLLAAAVALDAKIPADSIIGGLSSFSGVSGRMERVSSDEVDIIIDYAHTPDALERLLINAHALRQRGGRIILVFGCGGDRDRGKRKEMAHIASRLADICVVTSDNPRSEDPNTIIGDILKGIDKEKPYTVIASRKDAIRYAVSIGREGDMILLAGKGHEKYEINAEGRSSLDEREIALAALGEKRSGKL